jgi:Flp pilus assembly protein TadD
VSETTEPEVVDALALWIVEGAKPVVIEGHSRLVDADDRALAEESFDEDALLQFARERVAEAIRVIRRAVIVRALDDINQPP